MRKSKMHNKTKEHEMHQKQLFFFVRIRTKNIINYTHYTHTRAHIRPIKNSHVSTHVILTWVSTWALTWESRENFNHFLTCKSRESSHENHMRYGKMVWKNYIKISFWDYLWIYTFYNLSITYIYKRNLKFRN